MTTATAKTAIVRASTVSTHIPDRPDTVAPFSAAHKHELAHFAPSRDDSEHWMDLARQHGVRLPYASSPCTPGGMERWLRTLGLSVSWFYEYTGFSSLAEWIDHNPTWGLRSFVGLLLEECQ